MNLRIHGRNLALLVWVVSLLLGALTSLENSPKIITKEGNVVLEAGINKNITIRLPGRSRLVVNDLDLLILLLGGGSGISNSTSPMPVDGVSLRTLKEDLDSLKSKLSGGGGLSTRLTRLQNRTTISNPSNILSRTERTVSIIYNRLRTLVRTLTMDHCKSNPCENGGTCLHVFDGFLCKCTKGYEGLTCSADVNECALFAGTDIGCQNEAQCINQFGTYSCVCNSGWQGIHCSQRKTDCLHSSNLELCGHGTCVNTNDNFGYRCICEQGWESNGLTPSCSVDVDECQDHTNPCATKCINLPGGFVCAPCDAGYTGNGLSCRDIDECATNNGGCSVVPFAHCINSYGSFHCGECPVGWTGDGRVCTRNVNQQSCAMNNICHSLALCQEVSNRIICSCPVGLTGNGVGPNGCYSLGTNMCSSNPCLNGGSCMDIGNGSYTCLCPIGYRLPNCVQSFNQCAPNPCRNGGTCHPHGLNFTCFCITGYEGKLCDSQRSQCGEFMSAEQGNLKYPLNDLYSHNAQCSWVIRTNETKVLNITFSKFEIEDAVDCRFDWLQMHDGPTAASQLLGRFCGSTAPLGGNIITTTNQIYLWFSADNSTAKAGFDLSWSSIDPICGGVIEFDSHTTIASPGSPGNYPRNRDCKWHLKAPNNKRIKLVFFSLKIEKHSTCNYDYLEVTDAISMSQLEIFCNSSNPAPFTVPSNEIIVHFHSDNESTDLGFQIHVSTVERVPGCGGTYTDRNGLIVSPTDFDGSMSCEYVVRYPKGLSVQLEMNKFEMGDDDCIEIFDVNAGTKVSTGRWCGKMSVPIFKSAGNEVQINYYSKGGTFKMSYGTICEYTFEDRSGVITSPNYPNPYPSDETCTYEIIGDGNQVASIEFIDMDLESLDWLGGCEFDYVSIADGNNDTAAGPYCGTTIPPRFVSSASFTKLTLRTDQSNTGRGFKVNYTLIDTGSNCGGILKKSSAEIRLPSDSSSGHYQHDLVCIWTIIAPAGYGIQLSWLSFRVEYSPDCIFDYVEVFAEKLTSESAFGRRFCGVKVPPAIISAASVLTLKFVSDSTDSGDGFVAKYNFVDASSLCGGVIFASTGRIKSPEWPNAYPNDLNCLWSLSVQAGNQIELIVKSLDLEESEGCQNDWIEIRNGGSASSPLIGKYCGQTIPKRIPSFTHQIYVHFRTNSQKSKSGFDIEWQTVSSGCGGVISADHGSVASPFYPQYYGNDAQCEWKISVNKGSTIIITIEDLSLESLLSCTFDYVEIYDGLTIESRKIGRYCERPNDSSFSIETTGSDALIRFQSDSSNTDRGFYLSYVSNCNHVLNDTFGAIESPNFGNNNPSDVNCTWIIIAPKGNRILLDFDIVGRKDGYSNPEYVYLHESDNDTVIQITNPRQIESHGNVIQVWLSSSSTYFQLEYRIRGCVERMSQPHGEFSSPGYPNGYPHVIECIWYIETEIGNAIELSFKNVDIFESLNCSIAGIKVWNTAHRGHLIAKLCGKLDNITVSSTGHTMFVEFYSSTFIIRKGFKANYTTYPSKCGGKYIVPQGSIHSPNYPEKYDSNLHCEWLIQVSEHSTMSLTFEELDIEGNGSCAMDSLKIHDGTDTDKNPRWVICGNLIPADNVIHTTSNTAMLVFDTDSHKEYKGFKVSFKENCGKRIIVNDTGRIRFSGFDQEECLWVFVAEDLSKHVTFTTTYIKMNTNSLFPQLFKVCYAVKIFDGDFTNTTEIHPKEVFCSKHPPASTSLGHALTIQLDATLVDAFEGFYSIMDNNCGGEFTSKHGTFASPSYPIAYPVNIECIWEIVAHDGNSLTLTIQHMEIHKTEGCNDDYLEVREGNSTGRLIGVFCGDDVPSTLTAQKAFWIKFNSDNDNVGKGFIAEFSYAYHTELNGTSGIIEAPKYQNIFMPKGNTWRISVPRGNLIMLTFDYVLNFFSESVEIYNGYDEEAEPIEYDESNIVRSETNVLYICSNGADFKLHWYSVSKDFMAKNKTSIEGSSKCSNEIISVDIAPIMFQSPGYPNGYDSNLSCSWIIVPADPGSHAVINFLRIDLEDMNNCAADRVVIYSSIDMTNWKELDKKCKMKSDSILEFSSEKFLKVEFLTDLGFNKTGFAAKATSLCGSTMTETSGLINATDYSLGLNAFQGQCIWKIQVKIGRRIKITFIESELRSNSSESCWTHVLLKNGISEHSPNLGSGKYCDRDIPDIPITSSNAAYVKLNFERLASVKPKISFKYEEVLNECSHRINLDEDHSWVVIKSENYPNIPNAHTRCVWTIRGPVHRLVAVDFLAPINLERSALCESEYVELGDGSTNLSPVIARFCGDTVPNTQYSSGNTLRITHFTDVAEPNIGFSANVSMGICGGTYRELNGTISSPKVLGTNAMKNNLSCDYSISLPDEHSVNLTVNSVNLPWSDNCSEVNHLRISHLNAEGEISSQPILVCGSQARLNYLINSNRVQISYQILGPEIERSTFKLTYSSVGHRCSQTIEAESGILKSPGYFAPLEEPTLCSWKLRVPKGRRVKLEILEFNLDNISDAERQRTRSETRFRVLIANDFYFKSVITRFRSNPPAVIYSSDNLMRVTSMETRTSQKRGFRLRFSSEEETILCRDNFDKARGEIHFRPPQNISAFCSYNIYVRPNETIAMTVNKIDTRTEFLQDLRACRQHGPLSLKGMAEEVHLHRFCGHRNVSTLRLPYSVMFNIIKNEYNNLTLLDLSYARHNCGGEFTIGNEFRLSQPSAMTTNYGAMDCAWRVLPNPGDLDHFEVTVSVNFKLKCDEQYLVLYADSNIDSPHLGRFCNQETASNLISTKDLYIEYHTSDYESESTFNLTATVGSGCGGELSHPFRSIDFRKQYQNNVECIWTIRAANEFHISLSFSGRFFIESSVNCTKDYILIEEEVGCNEWLELQRICGREAPASINTTTSGLRFIFRSDDSGIGDGFTAHFERICGRAYHATKYIQSLNISGNSEDLKFVYNPSCTYTIHPSGAKKRVLLQIQYHDPEATGLCDYNKLIVYVDSQDPVDICIDNHVQEFRSSNAIMLVFKSKTYYRSAHFFLTYMDEKCGGIITSSTYIATPQQLTDSMYPSDMECIWNITAPEGSKMLVKFQKFEFQSSMGCSYDYVQVSSGKTPAEYQLIAKLCGNLTGTLPPFSIKSNFGIIQSVSDQSEPSVGFSALVVITKNCDKNVELKDLTDIYTLDDFAAGYENELDCDFVFRTAPGRQLIFEFSSFHLEESQNCDSDFLQFRDGGGPFADEIGRFCGHEIPNPVMSSRSTLYVRFVSDTSETSSGFSATVKSIALACGAHELFIKPNQSTIITSGEGGNYLPNLNCFWRLRSDSNIRLDFAKLDIQSPDANGTCTTDYLKISNAQPHPAIEKGVGTDAVFNGANLWANVADVEHIFCGQGAPEGYYTNGQEVYIKFFTDSSIESTGFKIIATTSNGCFKNFSSTQGRIFMDTMADCNVYINAPQNYSISLYFNYLYFSMGTIANCTQKLIEVFDERVNSTKVENVPKYCGSLDPGNSIFTDSNQLRIFMSHSGVFSNYDITFLASDKGPGCGGDLFNIFGIFTSPFYPANIRNNSDCQWNIKVPNNMIVHLEILVFDLGSKVTCHSDYLQILEHKSGLSGSGPADEITRQFCGEDMPKDYKSRRNIVSVRFHKTANFDGTGWVIRFSGIRKRHSLI